MTRRSTEFGALVTIPPLLSEGKSPTAGTDVPTRLGHQSYDHGTLSQNKDEALPALPTLKSQSLLAYLVWHRHRPQPRERLAGLFWGDRPEQTEALSNPSVNQS